MNRLVLTRKEGEGIVIDGPATITLADIKGKGGKVVIEAPPSTRIRRTELPPHGEQEAAAK